MIFPFSYGFPMVFLWFSTARNQDLWEDKPISVWKQMRDAARRLGLLGLFSGWQTRRLAIRRKAG
jgi:hypothetical protein